ncbi:FecCD family ABC transporter permease [Salirhabdus salicampi]|uniref:FecCD family ABC transporter permease n=1 Tax=Salirhabdus salicampi TaxID=476102 RepID=UPI0020C4D1D3|nr:iron ABC transporter permease [Salirhabdus salicampi]MCP8615351.1 iron ABC transporter permease [Salirhabdus salicampi]
MFRKEPLKIIGIISSIIIFGISFFLSIALGITDMSLQTVYHALFHFNANSTEHIIIQSSRLPRAIIGALIGACLAVSGALMQAITKNPLASPTIFGVNAGAICFVVLAVTFLSISSLVHYMWIAFIGAGVASACVYILGTIGRDGMTPIKIVLAGAAMTALFTSFTQGVLVLNETGLQEVLFWLAGSISGRTLDVLIPVMPYMIVGLMIAIFLGQSINILLFGDEVATGLGVRVNIVKGIIGILIVVLAGSSVAVAGAIGFIGLVVPHVARFLVGNDYRWVIPYCILLGGSLLLLADVLSRFVIMPQELPIGVTTALIGTPFFLYLARKRGFHNEG